MIRRNLFAFAWAAMTFAAFIAAAYGYKCDEIAPDPAMWALYVGGAIGGAACFVVGFAYAVEQRIYRWAGGIEVYINDATRLKMARVVVRTTGQRTPDAKESEADALVAAILAELRENDR